jgi:molybdopterin-guanine dinucleotide biosynthesis protein A
VKEIPADRKSDPADKNVAGGLFSTAAILVGGRSRRMGFDKFSIRIDQQKLLSRLADQLGQMFSDVMIVANSQEIELPAGTSLIHDIYPGLGPMAGIHAALVQATSSYVYVLACDMPRISADYIEQLKRAIGEQAVDFCCCRNQGVLEPFHAFYHKKTASKIARRLQAGDLQARYILGRLSGLVVSAEDFTLRDRVTDIFLNINTPDDLAHYLADPDGRSNHEADPGN